MNRVVFCVAKSCDDRTFSIHQPIRYAPAVWEEGERFPNATPSSHQYIVDCGSQEIILWGVIYIPFHSFIERAIPHDFHIDQLPKAYRFAYPMLRTGYTLLISKHNISSPLLLQIMYSLSVCLKPAIPPFLSLSPVIRTSRDFNVSGRVYVATMLGTLAIIASSLLQHAAAHGGCLNYTVGDTWYPG